MGKGLSCGRRAQNLVDCSTGDGRFDSVQKSTIGYQSVKASGWTDNNGDGFFYQTGTPHNSWMDGGLSPRSWSRTLVLGSPPQGSCLDMCYCCGCCGAILGVLNVLLFIICYCFLLSPPIEIHGVEFTLANYYTAMFALRSVGNRHDGVLQWLWANTQGRTVEGWYASLLQEPGTNEAFGPGPSTTMFYGWEDVKSLLLTFGRMTNDSTMERYNEFDMQILRPAMWNETKTIVFGLSRDDHMFIRPFLGQVLDGAEGLPAQSCDGSRCWNEAWLRYSFQQRFATLISLSSEDIRWIITVILHKIHINAEIPDADAKDFAIFQDELLGAMWWPRNWLSSFLFGTQDAFEVRSKLVNDYKTAVIRKWPNSFPASEPSSLPRATLLASVMLDSLSLAGGLSLPSVLQYMLAIMYMEGEPGATLRDAGLDVNNMDYATLYDFMFETIRRFPPVSSVPRWITSDGGFTWKRQIPNIAQALKDPLVFPSPMDFKLGRPGFSHTDMSRSLGWADVAVVNDNVSDPLSRSCPGKRLSIEIIVAFIKEFQAAGPWKVIDPRIAVNSYKTSSFLLVKDSS